ncbi:TRAP transporter small permease [Marinomonas piezotolerans]|uniref:TRAP transporter small permease protein n=1 Tax=Marinomonas piezotolerans TaxID=2213058 RepID=A0A370UBZ8_9GAMM|nr:TRAP transporter small permease [Marinomonas piezotolerans]RDL45205.1 TRAP transporter small permease [Marinomonas piezotolerans]
MNLCLCGKALDWLYRVSGALAALCLIGMTLCVISSIVSRLLGLYVPGTTEIAGYLMAAANCLALAYTFRGKAHIQVTLFIEKMAVKNQRFFAFFSLFITAIVTIYLAYYMSRLAYFSWDFHEVSDGSIAFPLWIPQSIVALGTIFFAISVVHSLFDLNQFSKEADASASGDVL